MTRFSCEKEYQPQRQSVKSGYRGWCSGRKRKNNHRARGKRRVLRGKYLASSRQIGCNQLCGGIEFIHSFIHSCARCCCQLRVQQCRCLLVIEHNESVIKGHHYIAIHRQWQPLSHDGDGDGDGTGQRRTTHQLSSSIRVRAQLQFV